MLEERGAENLRTYEEINQKIRQGDAVVLTADEFIKTVESSGLASAAKEVDVVTTGTFGAMCSSGAFINFGHADPPIKMFKCWLNDVLAYKGLAAVDCYIGATAISETRDFEYGGGHVIEDLVSGKEIELRAEAYGTDCYPRRFIETVITINDVNQAILLNPRNAYERYNAATNSTDRTLHTYMGTLLPHYGNVSYCGAGQLSPLYKDKGFETVGIGTRIFLGGGVGYIIGEGTQHNPQNQLGTLMVRGDLKKMNNRYLRGATYYKYGTTLYVGVGIPIPILNERVAASAALKDEEIFTKILDYGVPSRSRPTVKKTSYAELKSGKVVIDDREITSSSLSSFKVASEIAKILKEWITDGSFLLNRPAELITDHREFKPLEVRRKEPRVGDVMIREITFGNPTDDIQSIAKILIEKGVDHLPIADDEGKLVGIVTSWDLAKALAQDKKQLNEVMTSRVITAREDEVIDKVVRRMEQHNISGVPVVDESKHIIGMLTTDHLSRKLIRRPLL
ncbi:MAG: homocysteine biosynthesis protein [Candidatus Methylarchaceae archaeon HK01M]|nr:homocysteine biosynthesis protein [Candidatus Methylarchaceae archaeon HK01M]